MGVLGGDHCGRGIDMMTTGLETIRQVRALLAGIYEVELHVVQDEAE